MHTRCRQQFCKAITFELADGYPQTYAFLHCQCADFLYVVDTTTFGNPIWQDRFGKGTADNAANIVWRSRHWKGVWGKLEGIRSFQFHRLCSCTNRADSTVVRLSVRTACEALQQIIATKTTPTTYVE